MQVKYADMGRLVEITSEVSEPILIPSTYTETFKSVTERIKRRERMTEKTLNITSMSQLNGQVPDVQLHGNPDAWKCICKASSKEQGWMKSTKAMSFPNGVLIQVSTQQGGNVAEALEFIRGVKLVVDSGGTCHFLPF